MIGWLCRVVLPVWEFVRVFDAVSFFPRYMQPMKNSLLKVGALVNCLAQHTYLGPPTTTHSILYIHIYGNCYADRLYLWLIYETLLWDLRTAPGIAVVLAPVNVPFVFCIIATSAPVNFIV